MSGRPKVFEEEEVINKAAELFWARGYEASATEALLKAMGIGKGSFYLAFKGGKRELFERVLERISNRELKQFKQQLANSKDPVEEIRSLFKNIALASKETNRKGCIFGQTITDFSATDELLTSKAALHLKQLEQLFYKVILTAQENGTLKTTKDPVLLANYLITVWNGLGVTRRTATQQKALLSLIEMQLEVLY